MGWLDRESEPERGENPGGRSELRPLLYPFYRCFPKKAWSKFRWKMKERLAFCLPALNWVRGRITVVDRLGAPGDALLTAIVIHNLKRAYPRLRVTCITAHPELLKLDPAIEKLNGPESFFSFDSSYWDLVRRKDVSTNVVAHSLAKVGIRNCAYKARFHLAREEREWGKRQVSGMRRPLFSVNAASKEPVKSWPERHWRDLVSRLLEVGDVVQLGDDREPDLPGMHRLAGRLNVRESAAVLAHADLHVGPDSLLMHVANGLDVPGVILMGGSRPAACLGYAENENLTNTPACSPCWIHEGYESCEHQVKCMEGVSVEEAWRAVESFKLFSPHTD